MIKIFRFDEFTKIESSIFRLNDIEVTDEEVCYTGTLTINGEKILGQIFCEKNGALECFQFYQSDGKDICEIYGTNIIESIIKDKIKKLNNRFIKND